MRVSEASAAGIPLAVDIREGHTRIAAEIFEHRDGLVFLDIGWCDPLRSFHAAHLLEGEEQGHGPWTIGGYTIREIEIGSDEYDEWLEWKAAAREQGGCEREAGREYARQEFPGTV